MSNGGLPVRKDLIFSNLHPISLMKVVILIEGRFLPKLSAIKKKISLKLLFSETKIKRSFLAAVVKGVADEPSRKTNGCFKR